MGVGLRPKGGAYTAYLTYLAKKTLKLKKQAFFVYDTQKEK